MIGRREMNKIVRFHALSSILLLLLCQEAHAQNDPKSVIRKDEVPTAALQACSIFRDKDHMETASKFPRHIDFGERTVQSGGITGYEYLYFLNNGSNQKVKAIVAVMPSGRPILNPRHLHFDYGPIPILSELSLRVAEILWTAKENDYSVKFTERNKVQRSYELFCSNINGQETPSERIFVDVMFESNMFSKYRIRGKRIFAEWYDAEHRSHGK